MTSLTDLNKPLSELGLKENFVHQSTLLGINKMADMMHIDLIHLKKEKEFTMLWYADMLSLLEKHDLLSKYQENHL